MRFRKTTGKTGLRTMSKYDLVLYDLDGTLWDSIPLIMECFKKAYETVLGGTDRTDEDLMSYTGI